MTTSRSSSRRAIADAEGVTGVAPELSQSRCSGVLLDLTRSSIRSQDMRQSEPRCLSQEVNAVSSSRFSQSSNYDANRVQTSVGALMQPETGAWADRTSVFRQPVKPLGQDIIQAPLITAPQDALRLELRTNRLGNLRKTQAWSWECTISLSQACQLLPLHTRFCRRRVADAFPTQPSTAL